jgi:hypothetical protein
MAEETFRPEGYERKTDTIEGWPVTISSFRLKNMWHCTIDNVSPGAIVSRGQGPTRDDAVAEARRKAVDYLGRTKRRT